jgi:hypothetical protein
VNKNYLRSASVQLLARNLGTVKPTHGRSTMKKLTAYGLAFLLFTGTSAALAGRGDRGDHGRHNDNRGHYNNGRHHYNHYYRGHRNRFYNRRYYAPGYYYPSYLGAALIGSALTTSLYHSHSGERCYQSHANDQYRQGSSSNRQVVGCHRIEILADGNERRVEVPLSQCN